MLPPPPRSTLFPYTTLFRSVIGVQSDGYALWPRVFAGERNAPIKPETIADGTTAPFDRSEEHTSELQSQSNLVCRLLLEKKKKKIKQTNKLTIESSYNCIAK